MALVGFAIAVGGAGLAVGQAVQSGVAPAPLLLKGSQGPEVTQVQRALGIPATGVFDRRTDASVRGFQRRHGLLVDGIVGPQTRGALGIASPTTGSTEAPAAGAAGGGGLQGIAQCESGGNPSAIGAGGQYRGKYQFSRETWQSVGGSGDPAAAPEAEQDRRAAMLYARSGTASWPRCG